MKVRTTTDIPVGLNTPIPEGSCLVDRVMGSERTDIMSVSEIAGAYYVTGSIMALGWKEFFNTLMSGAPVEFLVLMEA